MPKAGRLMSRHVLFRQGLAEDSEDFERLILLSASRLLPTVLGTNASRILRSLFCHKRNLYSFEHSRFIEVNGRSAGMLISYDWKVRRLQRLRTGLLLLKYMKLQLITRLPILFRVDLMLGKVGVNEYYISNIAIYPEYRNLGFGTGLLKWAEDQAKRARTERIVLDVEANNQDAIKLYNRIGYAPLGKPRSIIVCGETHTFLRMSKVIYNAPTIDVITA